MQRNLAIQVENAVKFQGKPRFGAFDAVFKLRIWLCQVMNHELWFASVGLLDSPDSDSMT